MANIKNMHESIKKPIVNTIKSDPMGRALTRKPGDCDWTWSEFRLTEKEGFGLSSLQAMVGGGLIQHVPLTRQLALILDEEGLLKNLPYCIALRMHGQWQPLVGPIALVRMTPTKLTPLNEEDRAFLLSHFEWQAA